eukprot:6797845-Prymnesium_polylepis.1
MGRSYWRAQLGRRRQTLKSAPKVEAVRAQPPLLQKWTSRVHSVHYFIRTVDAVRAQRSL